MMIHLVDELTTLGFSQRIAEAYVLLAQKGELSARDVGERFSLARPTAHDVMMSLVDHGLARTKHDGKERKFVMASPLNIREKLEEKRRESASRVERFDLLLPNLQALAALGGGEQPAVRYGDDAEELAVLYAEFSLLHGDVIQLFDDVAFEQYVFADEKNLSSKRIRSMVITNAVHIEARVPHDIRVIPKSVLSMSGNIRVCADRVLLSSSGTATAVIAIRSQPIADVCRATLELAWCAAGKIEEWMK